MESHALLPSIDSTACPQACFLQSTDVVDGPGQHKKEESLRSANPWTGHPTRSRCNVRGSTGLSFLERICGKTITPSAHCEHRLLKTQSWESLLVSTAGDQAANVCAIAQCSHLAYWKSIVTIGL